MADHETSPHPVDEIRALEGLTWDDLLPDAEFGEVHRRNIDRSVDVVWQDFLALPAADIRLLKPLFLLRGLPSVLHGRRAPSPLGQEPVLDAFANEGFIMLRRDAHPVDGRAVAWFGAAGRFWSPAHNGPLHFDSPEHFMGFCEPGNAKTVARFEAVAQPDGSTRLETETIVSVTDPASRPKFALYWAVIRGPSGLLRRSWLAAVDRRAS